MKTVLRNCRGFSILEILGYLVLLGMLLSVIYSIYYQLSHTLSAADTAMLSDGRNFEAIRKIQGDIQQSTKVLETFGPFKLSDGALILSMKTVDASEENVVVYTHAESGKTLMRYQANAAQPRECVSSIDFGHNIETFFFSVDQKNANLVRVGLEIARMPYGLCCEKPLIFFAKMRNG